MADNKIILDIVAETKKAQTQIQDLKTKVDKLSTSSGKGSVELKKQQRAMDSLNASSKSLIGNMKSLVVAYAGFSAIKGTVSTMAEFETAMTKVQAVSGASADEMDRLSEKARVLGGSTEYSAGQVADAMGYMSMAGLGVTDTYNGVEDVLNLARVGMIDLGTASDIATNIMSGFGMEASDLSGIIDVMSATTSNSNTNMTQLGEAMKYVAPTASGLGVSIQDVSTSLGILGNAGLQGSIAGTTLNSMLLKLFFVPRFCFS